MSRVKMAMVGCGAIAENGHLLGGVLSDRVDFTVLIDRDEARARALADRFGIAHVATDIAAAADHAESACVALPPHLHRMATETLLGRGLHVLIEKPLAMDVADCDAIVAAAERADRILAVAMMRRFAPSAQYMKGLIESGMLGTIERFHVASGAGGSWPAHSLYMLRAGESGGGVLMSNGVHDLDLLTWLLGDVTDFTCRMDATNLMEGNCTIDCTLASGAVGTVELSRTATFKNTIRIDGSLGSVEAASMGETLSIVPRGSAATLAALTIDPAIDFARVMADQLESFAGAIRGEHPPMVSVAAGRDMVAFIRRCYDEAQPLSFPWGRDIAFGQNEFGQGGAA